MIKNEILVQATLQNISIEKNIKILYFTYKKNCIHCEILFYKKQSKSHFINIFILY